MKRYKAGSYEIKVRRVCESPAVIGVETPECALDYWQQALTGQSWFDGEREMVVALMLNTRLRVLGHYLVSIGSMNESIVHPREVYRAAVAMGAHAVVLMHNHPSGDPTPSTADHNMTKQIKEAGEILRIRLLDHVIVGADGRHYSFRNAGLV